MKNLSLVLLLILFASCGPGGGTTTGNPVTTKNVTVRMQDSNPFVVFKKMWDLLIPPAYANLSGISFCFKRLRFNPSELVDGSEFVLELGQVAINPSGSNLLTLSVPEGTYERIEFDLEKECDGVVGKPSITFTNDFGVFSTDEHTTIKFNGTFIVSADSTVTLNIDSMLTVLEAITQSDQIQNNLEAITGDFD